MLLTNPRGSSGYGEAFQRGVDKEWGGKAYQDVMAGVDAALAKYPWIDKNRLGVSGHSFGGFIQAGCQSNWIGEFQPKCLEWQVGRPEERFERAAKQFMAAGPTQGAQGELVNLLGVMGKKNRADQVTIKPTHEWVLAQGHRGGNRN